MGLTASDATAIGAFCVMVTAIAQAILNQRGADRARRHELDLKRLELEEEHEKESAPPLEPIPSAAPSAAEAKRRARILVVDDDEGQRAIMMLHLARLGYEGQSAAAGTEALALIARAAREERPFDLVFLDQSMPGMAGDSVAGILRANNRFMKIVFVTAHARRRGENGEPTLEGRTASELGALAIWIKPLNYEELGAQIEKILKD